MIRTSCMGDYYGRYLDPEAAAAQMKTLPVPNADKKSVAALHD
jgi:hypothetical protein